MILECKSCQKKFIVPDGAITSAGRLVQCSSCGNKWTQYPVINKTVNFQNKKEVLKKTPKIQPKVRKVKIFNEPKKKKKIIKKRSGPSIYSKEYLEKKHGINIDRDKSDISKNKIEKKSTQSYFGFYSYLLILLFTITTITGILHLTKEIVIFYFPFTEIYIENLFENLNNFGILFRDAFNIY
tara:strand:- start:14 stop:562 length:549 start_codon:yes stop_codon:yes gene_type:complete